MILFMYLVTQGELIVKRRWRDLVLKNVMKSKGKVLELSPHKQKLSQKEALLVLMFKGPEADEFNIDGQKKFGYFTVWFKYQMMNLTIIMQENQFKYFIIYIVASFLGILLSPLYYSFLLFDLIT